MRKRLLIAAAVFVLAGAGMAFAFRSVLRDALASRLRPELPAARPYVPPATEPVADVQPAPQPKPETKPAPVPTPSPTTPTTPTPLAKEANLAVPFISQAPHGDWSLPYQEACEEASLIMVHGYVTGTASITPDQADAQILAMVAWEKAHFGFYEDTTAEEVAAIARDYYGHEDTRVVSPASMQDVLKEIDKGHAVMVPAAGRLLGNPYFSGAGPLYHMLVIKGYTKGGKIITNDPGTRHGADYLYDPAVLWNAIHDWNGGDVTDGKKVMIVIGG